MVDMLTENSKIKELLHNPVGHDVICKLVLQLNLPKWYLWNPIVLNLRLKTVQNLSKKKLPQDFWTAMLKLMNQENDRYQEDSKGEIKKQWWKEAIFYQIYPRSFMDSNEDGIGDLNGIRMKLDYLKELGVDVLWLSPVYDSPNDDNGYDIRDYYKIMKEFGTMEDFDNLLTEIHDRDMKLIMDLVVNHTSDEHPWFQEALHNKESKYRSYYYFRDGEKVPPNNWTSFFSGLAWNYYEEQDTAALHLFSKKQMDLNWECEEMRKEVHQMIRWWLEKGVDGFRMDVINYISKEPGLPDGNQIIGELMGFYGIEHYFYGPKLHDYLKELKKEVFEPYQAFSVGEMPGIGREMGKLLTGEKRKELDLFFSFDHLENPGKVRFDDYKYDLNYWKEFLMEWNQNIGNDCQMTLFYNNHDNPRFLSKVQPDGNHVQELAKLLAVIQLTHRGTPFIFQGDEIGMINQKFSSMNQLRDIESINYYQELLKSMDEGQAFQKVLAGSRDHARVPMQWDASVNGGFSTVEPWILGDGSFLEKNVEQELKKEDGIFHFYQKMIALRKQYPVLSYGTTNYYKPKKKNIFCYARQDEKTEIWVECNLSEIDQKRTLIGPEGTLILSNYRKQERFLRPYEANIYLVTK